MGHSEADAASFTINPNLDVERVRNEYQQSRRVHIDNFLSPSDAAALYRHLSTDIEWRTFLVANERQLGTPHGVAIPLDRDKERQMFDLAYGGARSGFASLYDANRLLSEETGPSTSVATPFARLMGFLNSSLFLDLVRRVTGIPELRRVEAQATRFRSGHFVTFHDATCSADRTGKRRVNYVLSLTPEWRPEWGGLLEFRSRNGHAIEAFMPCFNALEIFAFPQGYWISVIAPFANGPSYAIAGSIYVA